MSNTTADIQTVEITSVDDETLQMEFYAKSVCETLSENYARHLWSVGWAPGGVLVVKLIINPDFNYGYTIDCARSFSASDLAHTAKMAGGELLERLGMKRGAWDGEMPTKNMEGVDPKRAAPIFRN